jgi:hypothetical protein
MGIEKSAQKWAVYIVGFIVLAVLATALIPLVTTQFATTGAFENSTCTLSNFTKVDYPTDNTSVFFCISNSYSPFYGAVPTLLIIVFVVSLILLAIGALKYGKHR